jgi:hypothetical protein
LAKQNKRDDAEGQQEPFSTLYPPLTRTPRLVPDNVGIRRPSTEPISLEGGCYDAPRRNDLKRELSGLEPHRDIVLELARTEHLDFSCIGILIRKLRVWRDREPKTNLRLRNISSNFAITLRLLKLDEGPL